MRTAIAHLYIPLFDNTGQPQDAAVVGKLRSAIIARFGGLTTWAAMGYTDGYPTEPVQVWEVVGDAATLTPYLAVLAQRIKRELGQDNVLISIAYGDTINA